MRSGTGWGAARFFRKVLKAEHTQAPRVVTVDNNAAYPVAMEALKGDETLAAETKLRQSKYLNNVIEQEHRAIKRIVKPMMGFKSFNTARRTLRGIEAMNMIRTRAGEWNQSRGQCRSSQVYQRNLWSCRLMPHESDRLFVPKKYLRHNHPLRGVPQNLVSHEPGQGRRTPPHRKETLPLVQLSTQQG